MAKTTSFASEDVVIESIAPSGVALGAFTLVVDIAGTEIGMAEQLAWVLGAEGATELDESTFSSDGLSFSIQRTIARETKTTSLYGGRLSAIHRSPFRSSLPSAVCFHP